MSVTGMRKARQAILHRSQAQAMAALAAPGMLEEELRRRRTTAQNGPEDAPCAHPPTPVVVYATATVIRLRNRLHNRTLAF